MKAEELGTLHAIIPGESGTQPTAVVVTFHLLAETGDFLMTEAGDNIDIEH